MTTTDILGLKKPDETDFYNVGDFNENADILDAAIGELMRALGSQLQMITKAEFEALVEAGQDNHDVYYVITDIDEGSLAEGGMAAITSADNADTFLAEVVE